MSARRNYLVLNESNIFKRVNFVDDRRRIKANNKWFNSQFRYAVSNVYICFCKLQVNF